MGGNWHTRVNMGMFMSNHYHLLESRVDQIRRKLEIVNQLERPLQTRNGNFRRRNKRIYK
jgi:hypothetical protein